MDQQDQIVAFKKEIFELVSQNKVPEAIGRLIEIYHAPEGTYYDDLLLLSRQFSDLTDRQLSGLLDDEDANIEKNQITHGLIHIVSNLHTDPVVAKRFRLPLPTVEQADPPKEKSKIPGWIVLVGAVFMIAIIGIFLVSDRNESADTTPTLPEVTQVEPTDNNLPPSEQNTTPQPRTQERSSPERPPAQSTPQERTQQPVEAIVDPPAQQPESSGGVEEAATPPPVPPSGPQMSAHSSRQAAIALQSGQQFSGTLHSRQDMHYYTFAAPRDGRVDFKLTNQTSTYSPSISVINPGGNRLIGTMARRGESISTWFRANPGETYTIQIGSRNSDPGKYLLVLAYQ